MKSSVGGVHNYLPNPYFMFADVACRTVKASTQGNAANDSLTQGTIHGAVKEYLKRLNACVVAKCGHYYYSQ